MTVLPRSELGTGDDTSYDFSIKVECVNGQRIVAERPMYFNYNGVWTGGHDVVGIPAPQTCFYFAEGTCRPGFVPYLCIQNPGDEQATAKITYMLGDGTMDSQEVAVAAHSRLTVDPRDELGVADDVAHDFSVKVESAGGQPIVVERPMYFNYNGVWTGGHDVIGTPAPGRSSISQRDTRDRASSTSISASRTPACSRPASPYPTCSPTAPGRIRMSSSVPSPALRYVLTTSWGQTARFPSRSQRMRPS